jgi:Domain of unknown function (DUF202)
MFDTRSDHLANGRTFLAWMRTGLAVVVFGFAIGRFAIASWLGHRCRGHFCGSVRPRSGGIPRIHPAEFALMCFSRS